MAVKCLMSLLSIAAGTLPVFPCPGWDNAGNQAHRSKRPSQGQSTITVTRNEILYGLNQADKFILALVIIDGESHEGPYYIRKPFNQEPDWAVTSINFDIYNLMRSQI